MSKTLLVLGAGASVEFGLPMGDKLKDHISGMLNMRDGRGDEQTTDCFRILARQSGASSLTRWAVASRVISGAMPHALSIDNFLHQRGDNEAIVQCGKLAIVRSILGAERKSKLAFDENHEVDLGKIVGTWINPFFKLLVEGCRHSDLDQRLKQLRVVSFNYDRCFEHALLYLLMRYYTVSEDEAARLVGLVEVYHPYGQVGHLPWQALTGTKVELGAQVDANTLIDLAGQIKTFTEGTDPAASHIVSLRHAVASSERIIYLGFAYYDQNLSLLYGSPLSGTVRRRCWGTRFRISDPNARVIHGKLGEWEGHDSVILDDTECLPFVDNFSRSFQFV